MKTKLLLTLIGALALVLLVTVTAFRPDGGAEPVPQAKAAPVDSTVCIASKEYMKAHHMQVLDKWRHEAVRDGDRIHVTPDGRQFEKSLNTCLGCHSKNRMFCFLCHQYANVKPTCWNCHLSPKELSQ
ncbi:hypothetical protein CHL67_00205 [Prosthecochloris sp. GSB1]|uniref:sulfate reduction electron transfer complex DsrMKJOP subunit DsrJ n=1 Tax=Prosthecochloris sp. GSB1 TaxID=281093 RepID=UPI000B8C9BB5|nr:sulfate reduction electron transfer complex DsrMKJOP subunit DsrJ [Prosthecochloris sp. GSB1]ASQ89569.1 hypothetical protein CHL67_00205 [Prosthecochloris sp. GSB1]